MTKNKKTNPTLIKLIQELKIFSHTHNAPIWRDIAKRLEKPSKRWSEVNISKIDQYTKNGETAIVPGTLLGSGDINKKVTIAALRFSTTAKKKITNAGGTTLSIIELAKKNPKGSNIKIMG